MEDYIDEHTGEKQGARQLARNNSRTHNFYAVSWLYRRQGQGTRFGARFKSGFRNTWVQEATMQVVEHGVRTCKGGSSTSSSRTEKNLNGPVIFLVFYQEKLAQFWQFFCPRFLQIVA
ncbi:hypothetical protein VPH35_103999 [Triticum aestivum]